MTIPSFYIVFMVFSLHDNSKMSQQKKIIVINGPNLNLLGQREPNHYGCQSLQELIENLHSTAKNSGILFEAIQSNAEHELISSIQQTDANFILLNAGAYTHTSIAIRDALLAIEKPFIEIHVSNIYAREKFRQSSMFADIAQGVITGFGTQSYHLGIQAAIQYLSTSKQ